MVLPNAPEPSGRRKMFVCIPGSGLGYVGVSTVTGEAMRFDDAVLNVDGVDTKMANQNSACKLWDRFTLIGLACRFSLTD